MQLLCCRPQRLVQIVGLQCLTQLELVPDCLALLMFGKPLLNSVAIVDHASLQLHSRTDRIGGVSGQFARIHPLPNLTSATVLLCIACTIALHCSPQPRRVPQRCSSHRSGESQAVGSPTGSSTL